MEPVWVLYILVRSWQYSRNVSMVLCCCEVIIFASSAIYISAFSLSLYGQENHFIYENPFHLSIIYWDLTMQAYMIFETLISHAVKFDSTIQTTPGIPTPLKLNFAHWLIGSKTRHLWGIFAHITQWPRSSSQCQIIGVTSLVHIVAWRSWLIQWSRWG